MDEDIYLSDLLYQPDALESSHFDPAPQDFWPRHIIETLIEPDAVRRELYATGVPYDDKLVDFVVRRAKKLFTIAVTATSRPGFLPKAMKFFQENQFDDSCLKSSAQVAENYSRSDPTPLERLIQSQGAKKLWTDRALYDSRAGQWKVLAPVFSPAVINCDFRQEAILPFTEMKANEKKGAFSKVYRAVIHPDHYEDPEDSVSCQGRSYLRIELANTPPNIGG